MYVGYLHDLSTQYRSGSVCSTGRNAALKTHTQASCLAIWWRLLHHLNITHRRGKSRSNVQQGKSFFKRSPESTAQLKLFLLKRSFPRKRVLLLSSARNHIASTDDRGFSLTLSDKRQVVAGTLRLNPAGTDLSLQLCSVSHWMWRGLLQTSHISSTLPHEVNIL